MNCPDRMQEIAAILAEEAAAACDLRAALFAERQALAASDDGALTEATTRKATALATLERTEDGRQRKLREIAPNLASGDMQPLLERLSRDTTATSATTSIVGSWNQLRATLQQCRDVNAANGQVVASLQRQVQQALNLLRGSRGTVATYGPTGSTRLADAGPRELARA